jgi:hypothetical protein
MSRFLQTLIVVVLAAAAASAQVVPARPSCDNAAAVLDAYLTKENVKAGTYILARDHRGAWLAGKWTGTALEPSKDTFTGLSLTEPRVNIGEDEVLRVYVYNTNPLIFSSSQTSAALVDRADLAALGQLATALGNVVTAGLNIQGTRVEMNEQFAITNKIFMDREASRDAAARRAPRQRKPEKTPEQEIAELARSIIDLLRASANDIVPLLNTLANESDAMEGFVDQTTQSNEQVTGFVTRVERGQDADPLLTSNAQVLQLPVHVDNAFTALDTARMNLRGKSTLCKDLLGIASSAVLAKLDGLPEDALEKRRAKRKFNAETEQLRTDSAGCSGPLLNELGRLGDWLAAHPVGDTPASGDIEASLDSLQRAITTYDAVRTARDTALTAAAEALGKRGATVIAAGAYVDILDRQQEHYINASDCSLIAGALEVPRTFNTSVDQPFTKEGKETFAVKVDERFEKIGLRHPAELTSTYVVSNRAAWDVDVDIAPVYTTVSDPTYAVGTKTLNEGTPEEKEQKYILRKDEKSLAGELVIFATFKGKRFTTIRPQIGASLSTDNPGLFAGFAYAINSYFKISTGWSFQKVTRLAEGLSDDLDIARDDELRTREAFGDGWYAALSLTLDDLPFFKAPE